MVTKILTYLFKSAENETAITMYINANIMHCDTYSVAQTILIIDTEQLTKIIEVFNIY